MDPRQTINWTMNDVIAQCDEYNNCLKKWANLTPRWGPDDEKYDTCIENAYRLGPAAICENTLRDLMYYAPNQLNACVRDYLNRVIYADDTCEDIYDKEGCFYEDIRIWCELNFITVFEEHFYNRMKLLKCKEDLRLPDPESFLTNKSSSVITMTRQK